MPRSSPPLLQDPQLGAVLLVLVGILGALWGGDGLQRSFAPASVRACSDVHSLAEAGPRLHLQGCAVDLLHAERGLEAGEVVALWLALPRSSPAVLVRIETPATVALLRAGTQAESAGPEALQAWTEAHWAELHPTVELAGELQQGWRRSGEARARAAELGAPELPVLLHGRPPSRLRGAGGLAAGIFTLLVGVLGLVPRRTRIERGRALDLPPGSPTDAAGPTA